VGANFNLKGEYGLSSTSRWITPSIFQAQDGTVVDEWTLCEKVANAEEILKVHWDSWVTRADFDKIKDAGFNTVRVPIGCQLAFHGPTIS
jgi:glucan 1,3-beta-glucosidase